MNKPPYAITFTPKHNISDIVYIMPDSSQPRLIEIRLVEKINYQRCKQSNDISYFLDDGKEYSEGEVLNLKDVSKLNKPQTITQPFKPKF